MLVIDSLLPRLSVVLAAKVEPSPPVVKMAHGGLLKVVDVPSTAPSPTCSLGVPLNVATNSIMWSGVNVASVRTLAPSITSWPPVKSATVGSTKCADDTVKLAGVPGAIAEFDDASVDVTR